MPIRSRSYYESTLSNARVQGALGAIRAAEGTAKAADPYSVGFGHRTISTLDTHPGRTLAGSFTDKKGRRGVSTAAGAYQMLSGTWDSVSKKLGLTDFSPLSQDIAAVALMDEKGALKPALKGDIKGFVSKAKGTWASLPGAKYNQPTVSMKTVQSAWEQAEQTAVVSPENVPAPTFAQRDVGGLLAPAAAPTAMGLAPAPTASPAQAAISAALSPAKEANVAARLGSAPAMSLSSAQEANLSSRLGPKPASTLSPAQEANLASRLGPAPATTLSPTQEANLASRLGPAPTAQVAPTKTALSPAKEANLADRLGPAPSTGTALSAAQEKNLGERLGVAVNTAPSMSAAKAANVTGRLNAAEATTSAPSMSIGGLLGVSPAAAGTITNNQRAAPAPTAPAAAPKSTGFAGPIGSPRSMEATIAGPSFGARYSPAPSAPKTAAPAPSVSAPASTNFAGAAGSPRAAQEQSMASIDAQDAIGAGMFTRPSAVRAAPAPSMSPEAALAADVSDQRKAMGLPALSAPRTVSSPPATYSAPAAASPAAKAPAAPQSIDGAVGRNRQATGLGEPSIPSPPSLGAMAASQIGNHLSQNKGKMAGGLLGSMVAGPMGGLLGGLAGQAMQKAATVQPSARTMALAQAGLVGGLVDGGYNNTPTPGFFGSLFGGLFGGGAPSNSGYGYGSDGGSVGNGYGTGPDPWGGLRSVTGGSRGGGIGPGGSGARDPSA